jgi:membrane protease YdiL (CAAX protease family)
MNRAGAPEAPPAAPPQRVDVVAVAVYLLVAFGAAWLVTLPLWTSGRGLQTPGAVFLMAAMMAAPTLGVLVVVGVLRRRPGTAHATGLRSPGGIRSWWRWGLLAWLGPLVLAAASVALAAAVGVYQPDLEHFSGLAETLRNQGAGALPVSLGVLAALQLAQVLVIGWVNVIPALGEEWGWRGWLLPQLLPLGRWPAVLAVGVVWGLWHAPVLLLGYNYPLHSGPVRVLLMVGMCVALGSLLGWLRLRSGSVWPAAIGHGFVNAVAGLPILFSTAGVPVDNATTGLLGWTGWVVMALGLAVAGLVVGWRADRGRGTNGPGGLGPAPLPAGPARQAS